MQDKIEGVSFLTLPKAHEITTPRKYPLIGPAQRTPEWYAMRPKVFGASVAAALCGRSEYKQPLDIYLDHKRGEEEDISGQQPVRMGIWFEQGILSGYAETEQVGVRYPLPMLIHPDCPHLVASLDGRVLPDREAGLISSTDVIAAGKPVDAKWSMSAKRLAELGEEGTDWVPDDWFFQVQQQMDVTCEPVADIAVVIFGRLKIYTVQRSESVIDAIHSAADEMLERLANNDPPAPHWTHPRAEAAVKELFDCVAGKTIVLPKETCQCWARIQELSAWMADAERELTQLKARVLWAMGDAELGRLETLPESELKRICVTEKRWTAEEVEKAVSKANALKEQIGEVSRKAYSYLRERKVKS